jgi:hypothetical protein
MWAGVADLGAKVELSVAPYDDHVELAWRGEPPLKYCGNAPATTIPTMTDDP